MRTERSSRYLAMFATVVVRATACGGGDGGDEAAGEPNLVGGIFDLSGATGDVGTPYSEGVRDLVAWRNSTQDGVGGRELELIEDGMYVEFEQERAR